jgi:putative hemolysin
MAQNVITIDTVKEMIPFFKTRLGSVAVKLLFRMTSMDKVNNAYVLASEERGINFVTRLLDVLNVNYEIENEDALKQLPEGFITVSNHPYGGLDGIILIHMMGSRYPNYKLIVNWILSRVEAMSDYFICVDPVSSQVNTISVKGIKDAEMHLIKNEPLGMFPAGSVSRMHFKGGVHFEDHEWHTSVCKMIKSAKKTVVPIYFHGHNSLLFYLLALIHWKLSSLRLPCEIFNKKGKTIHITIGKTITVEEQSKYKDINSYGDFLKKRTYDLKH